MRPDRVAPSSDYQAHCICPNGHRWKARVDHRTWYSVGCGHAACNLTPRSESEVYLSFEISQFFRINPNDQTIEGPKGETLNVDIKIPEERVVVVYFDDAYWHRGREDRDTRKSERLRNAGWKVVRVRDHGLGEIAAIDVPVDTRSMSQKQIANRTLIGLYRL